ncbi:sugar ABC transporter substrate-binding protein [Lysinibacillus sp. FSL K6-0232]|uniref:sugar ABC transporter substrate-binding protein n=1 Tax=Lysinibacillus sp. FSL K6-0232 TaxID=2921425 RepID=UPI0030F7E749
MKKVFKPFLSFALVSSLFLAACGDDSSSGSDSGSSSGSDGDKNVSVVLKTVSSPYWKYVEAGAKKAGEDLGVNVTVVGPSAESEVIQQVNMLEDQISQSPDAILISPTQPDTVIPALERAAKDIPVILVDSDADFEGKVSFIGTENYNAGVEGGKQLASLLQSGDKVVLISGALGNPATDDRIKGAKEALEEAGMVVVSEQPADSDKTKAMSVMENILEKDQDVKGVFAASDDMALGALRAVQARDLDIKVFGVNGDEEAVNSILEDGLTGSVAQNPYDMGYQGVEIAVKAAAGESVEERIDSGITIITKENAQEHLDFLKSISK